MTNGERNPRSAKPFGRYILLQGSAPRGITPAMRYPAPCLAACLSALALAACTPTHARTASAASAPAPAPAPATVWAFETSDVPRDPDFRFGQLPNGLRYVVRHNATPKGTGIVRMNIAAGSLDESDGELGYAHFVEHMAFNGSRRVPEGEMIPLLERKGLAFGADTNATTTYDRTTYMLDLPTNEAGLLDTALMLMRETASELTITPEAVARERGVVSAELRDRNTFALRNYRDGAEFFMAGARLTGRLPIGTAESLATASAAGLRAFWQREYVPAHTTVVVIGDFPVEAMEAAVHRHFADWRAAPAQPQPGAGPIAGRGGAVDIYIDPALSEQVTVARQGPWLDEPDTIAQRRENVLREVGYAIVNRRLRSIARVENAPFRAARFGTDEIYRAGRSTELEIDTVDAKWRRGLVAAGIEYRRALAFGFTEAEVAEQLAIIRGGLQNAAAGEQSRSHRALFNVVLGLITDRTVPGLPSGALERFETFAPQIAPAAVLAALKREALPLDEPLLRFQGRIPPAGDAAALSAAWAEVQASAITAPAPRSAASFGYTAFGLPGTVVEDRRDGPLGIRTIRFANNVRLNLKRTDLAKNQVLVQVSVDGGQMLATRANPLAVQMTSALQLGGLGQHSKDELDSLLAGRTVSSPVAATPETFVVQAGTTPRDLALQLQLAAAQLTDPGYRVEGQTIFRQNTNNMFAALRATPGSALAADFGGIVSDNDPRFTLAPVEDYRKLTFAKLKTDIAERLAHGAVEIGIVGDVDEDAAIAAVAATFAALPAREADFRPYPEQRQRSFTANRSARVLHHTGAKDQALVTVTWPTRDGEDPVAELQLDLLERVVRIELLDTLREKLGKAYSAGASSDASRVWRGYGTFRISAPVAAGEVAATRVAIRETIAALRAAPIDADVLLRARAPLLDAYDNLLKTNGGWLALVDRAQTEPDRIDRYRQARARLAAVTPAELTALARRYLTDAAALEVTVLPEGVE